MRPRRRPRRGCARSACAESPRRGDRPSSRTRRGVRAISAFRNPCATRASTSSSREVRLAGFSRVAGRGPRGTPRAPRSRSRRATIAAAGCAPRRCSSSKERRRASSPSASASASAASYGHPSSSHSSAARSQSPASWAAYGPPASAPVSSTLPARSRQVASSPITQEWPRRRASSSAAGVELTSSLPASQAASALAAAAGSIRCNSPVSAASAHASSSKRPHVRISAPRAHHADDGERDDTRDR